MTSALAYQADARLGTPSAPTARSRTARLVLGRPEDPTWARPALLGLLAATAVLYLWDLSASGYGNEFYAAAAQAGSTSWKALLFGSLDGGSSITVDKPPAALWIMGLSVRAFGLSSWSVMAPQALEGVAAVGLLYATVTRVSGRVAGLVAGAALAVTPAAVLMFRFDNPDALLVLLMVAGAWCVVRALEDGRTRWLLLAGTAVGFGFLTKMGQALLVVPGFGLAYLVAGPPRLGRRIAQLLGALMAVVLSAGWFVALVSLWPASSRPYIAGSGDNTELGLALGYNGLGRLFGSSSGSGGGGGGNFAGTPGLTRLFSAEMGYEIGWLLPAALLALPLGLWLTRGAPRTDRTRASLLLWGGWLLVTGYTLSEMQGGEHPYYSLALAPAVAALPIITGRIIWQQRRGLVARAGAAVLVVTTAVWSSVLLQRSGLDSWVCVLVIAAAAGLAATLTVSDLSVRRTAAAVVAGALLAVGGGTTAFAAETAGTVHTGTILYAVSSSDGGFGGGFGGGPGGSSTTTSSNALVELLTATTTRWAAATSGSSTANTLQLASNEAVMAIGGFNGGDPSPTLAQFEAWVKAGDIHYYVAGGGGGGFGGRGGNGSITTWVAAHYTATTVAGYTVYDLTTATS